MDRPTQVFEQLKIYIYEKQNSKKCLLHRRLTEEVYFEDFSYNTIYI